MKKEKLYPMTVRLTKAQKDYISFLSKKTKYSKGEIIRDIVEYSRLMKLGVNSLKKRL